MSGLLRVRWWLNRLLGPKIAEGDQELVCLLQRLLVIRFAAPAIIEKAMPLPFEANQFAAVAGGFHSGGEGLCRDERDGAIRPAMENNDWRRARPDMLNGRQQLRFGAQALDRKPRAEAVDGQA